MQRTPEQQREWDERMAASWDRYALPVAVCEACGGMADAQGQCFARCDRQPIRPVVTATMITGLALLAVTVGSVDIEQSMQDMATADEIAAEWF